MVSGHKATFTTEKQTRPCLYDGTDYKTLMDKLLPQHTKWQIVLFKIS